MSVPDGYEYHVSQSESPRRFDKSTSTFSSGSKCTFHRARVEPRITETLVSVQLQPSGVSYSLDLIIEFVLEKNLASMVCTLQSFASSLHTNSSTNMNKDVQSKWGETLPLISDNKLDSNVNTYGIRISNTRIDWYTQTSKNV